MKNLDWRKLTYILINLNVFFLALLHICSIICIRGDNILIVAPLLFVLMRLQLILPLLLLVFLLVLFFPDANIESEFIVTCDIYVAFVTTVIAINFIGLLMRKYVIRYCSDDFILKLP